MSTPQAPPLSPIYVKDTIAALTASRRARGARLDNLDLFQEKCARPDDPVELQLLFAARDDYLTATTPSARATAMTAMTKLIQAIRLETEAVSSEMNRLLISAMTSETAQKKINAMLKIAEDKRTRNASLPTLADMLKESNDASPEETELEGSAGERSANELQAEPGAEGVLTV